MIISILRTVILYVFIILAIRLMGKRQISDMQPSELVVTLVVSDIASLPMQNTSQPLLSGVIPVLVLVSLEIAASALMMKSRLFRRLICGNPVVVIEDGKLLQKQLKRLRMSAEDLFAQLRQQVIFSIDEVQTALWKRTAQSAFSKSLRTVCRPLRIWVSQLTTTSWRLWWSATESCSTTA